MKTPATVSFLASEILKSPRAAGIGVGAAVLSPFVFESDDRGYFKTALLTTPLVLAGMTVLPDMFWQSVREGSTIADYVREGVNVVKLDGPIDAEILARNLRGKSPVPFASVQDAMARFMQPEAAPPENLYNVMMGQWRKANPSVYLPDVPDSFDEYQKMIEGMDHAELEEYLGAFRNAGDIGPPNRVLTNAVEGARRHTLGPAGLIKEQRSNVFEPKDIGELETTIDKYQDNPEFVRDLNRRLRQSTGLVDEGGQLLPRDFEYPLVRSYSSKSRGKKLSSFKAAMDQMRQQSESIHDDLARALKNNQINRLTLVAETTADGSLSKILSYKIYMGRESLTVDMVNHITGEVRMRGRAVGAGRRIIGPNMQASWVDEYIARLLANKSAPSISELEKVKGVGYVFNSIEPTENYNPGGVFSTQGNQLAITLQSKKAVVTPLAHFGEEGDTYFREMGAAFQSQFYADAVYRGADALAPFTLAGTEGGVSRGVLELEELSRLSMSGLMTPERQNALYRAMSKGVHLSGDLPGEFPVAARTDYLEKLVGGEAAANQQMGLRVLGIAPQEKMLFGDLPETLEGLRKPMAGMEFVRKLQEQVGGQKAREAFAGVLERVKTQKQLDALRSLGNLGETETMLRPDIAQRMTATVDRRYVVDRIAMKGTMESLVGRQVETETILGYNDTVPVTPDFKGTILSATRGSRDQLLDVVVRHEMPSRGLKLDIAGVKGLETPAKDWDFVRDTLNQFWKTTGSANYMSDQVMGISDLSYLQGKIQDKFEAVMNVTGDVLTKLQASPEGRTASQPLIKTLAENEYHFRDNQLVRGSDWLADTPALRQTAADQLTTVVQGFFDKIGEQIRDIPAMQTDADLLAYAQIRNSGQQVKLFDWMLQNSFNAPTMAWDSTQLFRPNDASVTPDVLSNLSQTGNFEALKQIKNRLRITGGEPQAAIELGQHIVNRSQESIGAEVPINDIFPRPKAKIGTAEFRSGSIFDPDLERYRKPFTINLTPGGKHKKLFVPGTETFGGETHLYGAEHAYETKDWQRFLRDKIYPVRDKPALVDKLIDSSYDTFTGDKKIGFTETLLSEMFVGKKKAFSPASIDPMAYSGFLQTKSSGDPFTAWVGDEFFKSKAGRRYEKNLRRGDPLFANLTRQPISFVPTVRVRYDPTFTGGGIATDERLRAPLASDTDRDLANLHILEDEAAAEAATIHADVNSFQWRQLRQREDLFGRGEESRTVNYALNQKGGFFDQTRKQLGEMIDLGSGARRRATAGSIGELSNVYTRVLTQMERAPGLRGAQEELMLLRNVTFGIRQVPISAPKGQIEGGFGLEKAQDLSRRLSESLDEANPERFHGIMGEILGHTAEKYPNAPKLWAEHGLAASKRFMEGVDPHLAKYLTQVTTSNNEAVLSGVPEMLKNVDKYLPGFMRTGEIPTGAEMSSGMLGELNRIGREASRVGKDVSRLAGEGTGRILKEARGKGAGKVLGIGLGVAAVAGLLSTSLGTPQAAPSFAQPSSNRYRPEESIGTDGGIPGEDVAGIRAPSNPPRRVLPPPAQTRTTMVAPMNDTSDLEVSTRGEDRSRAIETAKLMGQMSSSGGYQNVNVNVRNASHWDTLQGRERIRNMREEKS